MKTIDNHMCKVVSGGIAAVVITGKRQTQDGGVYIASAGNGGGNVASSGGGGAARITENLTKAAVASVSLMTGLITENPVRVTTASFTIGYSLANALGAEQLGHKIGGAVYNISH